MRWSFDFTFPGVSYFVIWNFIEAEVKNEDKEVEKEEKELKIQKEEKEEKGEKDQNKEKEEKKEDEEYEENKEDRGDKEEKEENENNFEVAPVHRVTKPKYHSIHSRGVISYGVCEADL